MKNYINFYFDNDNSFTAEIHKDGKYRIVKNEKNLLKLLEISQKYGHRINKEGILKKDAKKITKKFDNYMKRKNKLRVIGKILENMQLSRKNPTIGKTLVTASILAVIAVNGIGLNKQDNHSNEIPTSEVSQVQVMDELQHLDTTPILEEEVKEDEEVQEQKQVEQENNVEEKNIEEDNSIEENKTVENTNRENHISITSRSSELNMKIEQVKKVLQKLKDMKIYLKNMQIDMVLIKTY